MSHQNCSHDHSHEHESHVGHDEKSSQIDANSQIGQFFNGVRFGLKSQVQNVLKDSPHLVNELDSSGCSAAHWAAKRGDIEMLEILYTHGGNVSLVANTESKMCPIHWAASEGKLASVAFLLDRQVDINIQDANGCTPVIIATQHNHQECVVYFIRKGADMSLTDNNGDSAIHWAAYKGFVEMTGLLVHSMPRQINSTDSFGQGPLHLAALRGNHDVVEYLIYDCDADVSLKDKNGLNPLELSIKKNQLKCEWVLRRKAYRHWLGILRSLSTNRLRDARIVRFFLCGSNDKEISAWPWRIVFLSNLLASYTTVVFATNENLVDLYYLHLFNSMVQVLWWIMFLSCLFVSPSFVVDKSQNEINYERVLERICDLPSNNNIVPSVCHSCHSARPLRAKHCKFQRRCVHKFDHFCPFVGNTVGRDNYKFFVGLLVMHVVCGVSWLITVVFLWRRTKISWLLFGFAIYSILWMGVIFSLLSYHLQLISQNLTTNEHIKSSSYSYLRNAYNLYDNPFDKGSFIGNLVDSLFPSSKIYFLREEVIEDKKRSEF